MNNIKQKFHLLKQNIKLITKLTIIIFISKVIIILNNGFNEVERRLSANTRDIINNK